MMTRFLFLSVLIGAMPLTMAAQDDDLYFTPKKHAKDEARVEDSRSQYDRPTYYCGSNRNVDEYNRRGKLRSYYQKIGTDSLGNDIIEFHAGDGTYGTADTDSTTSIYPGSESYYDDNDFAYSRRMGRFDGFYGWYDPYYYSYWGSPYWRSYYGWYDPWYAGWYGGGWYSPWYYDSFYGWGYPYYGWRGWYAPAVHYGYAGPSGTRNHAYGGGNFYGNRTSFGSNSASNGFNRGANSTQTNRGTFGQRRSTYNNNNNNYNRYQYQTPSRPSQSFGQSGFGSSRGSFGGGAGFGGGSRGGGSFGGGSRGGGFGGRR